MDALVTHCLAELALFSVSRHPALQSVNFRLSMNQFDQYQQADIDHLVWRQKGRVRAGLPMTRLDTRAGQLALSALKPRVRPGSSPSPAPAATSAPAADKKDGQTPLLLTNESEAGTDGKTGAEKDKDKQEEEEEVRVSTATHVAPWSLAEIAAESWWSPSPYFDQARRSSDQYQPPNK